MLRSCYKAPEEYKPTKFYAVEVLNCTSRYNTRYSFSYAPENVTGRAKRLHQYGDFPDTYMLRSYGRWWNESKAAQKHYRIQDVDHLGGEDYITLKYECAIIPKTIHIHETYNPGAVVRIWGRLSKRQWKILWEGPPQVIPSNPREFSPPIDQSFTVINEVRLEFNQSHLRYHTSLDSVELMGFPIKSELQIKLLSDTKLGTNNKKKQALEEKHCRRYGYDNPSYSEKTRSLERTCKETVEDYYDYTKPDMFSLLPHEIVTQIFQYLDLKSLCRCAQVNKQWYNCSLDSIVYQNLTLRKYWHKIDDNVLMNFFLKRCKSLKKLDCSWCGDAKISEPVFVKFLGLCGKSLTHLSMGDCDFVHFPTLSVVAKCKELEELRVRNLPCDFWEFSALDSFEKLVSIDFYATNIKDDALIKILRMNPGLRHIIIDSCENLRKLDQVAECVAECNRQLITWSSWKTHSLSSSGVKHLAVCRDLEELDLGWCLILSDPLDCLEYIAKNCLKLRRLIISGWRGLTDNLLFPVIRNCKQLSQLDLLGNKNVSANICETALTILPNLELMDLSFCDSISDDRVAYWREKYPHVSIQRSCECTEDEYLYEMITN